MTVEQKVEQSEASAQTMHRMLRDMENILKEFEANEARHELIREMDKAILRSTLSPQEVFDLIIRECLSTTNSQYSQVIRYRRNKLTIEASSDRTRVGAELPLHQSLCGTAVLTGEIQHYADVSQVPEGKYWPSYMETKSELVVPIKPEHSSRILGVLDLQSNELGEFPSTSVAFAEVLAGQAAIAITHTQTWAGISMLYDISTELLSGEVPLEESYQTILDTILDGFDFERGHILRLEGNEFVILASSRPEDVGLRPGRNTSICGQYLIAEGKRDILVIKNIEDSHYREFHLDLMHSDEEPMCSEIIVPLIEDDRLIGALNIESSRAGVFSDLDRNLLGIIGKPLARAIAATFARTIRVEKARIEAANLALTQLGNVAQWFLHRFGNNIGDARGKLVELKEHLTKQQLPPMRNGTIPVTEFIVDVTDKLAEARKIIDEFSNRFNPNDPHFQLTERDLEKDAQSALENARKRYSDKNIKFQFENRMPSAMSRTQENVGGKALCQLSEQICEVIENLLDNAVEAILEKGTDFCDGQITLVLDLPSPSQVRLQVQDNGAGIAEANRESVFKFGFSTRSKSRASYGVGLWFCDLYVRQRGGQIRMESTPGKGTTFEIILPTVWASAES